MKKVASRPSPSSFTADPFAEDAADSNLGSLIHRPEAVGSAGLAQNSNFFQKLQLAQNSLRSQDVDDGLRNPEAFTSVMVSTLDGSRPADRFSPLKISAAAKTRTGGGGGAVFPQELDIITVSSGGGGGSAQSGGGFFEDFDFEEAPRFEAAPAENLFRVSSQLRVGGRDEEKEDDLRFPGTVLEDATTRKIGNNDKSRDNDKG
jgi:hypothetical protein